MKFTKEYKETHTVGDVEVVILWRSFLGFNYARQMRIYRNGVWVI
jgi:hypothetical protein